VTSDEEKAGKLPKSQIPLQHILSALIKNSSFNLRKKGSLDCKTSFQVEIKTSV